MNLSTFDLLKNAKPEDGFFLDEEQLARLHAVLTEMLRDITSLAEENGICLRLSGGTLLGALRNGRLIPWDDDADLVIERKDYVRMLTLLREQRADRYWVHTPEDTHDYGIMSVRVRDKSALVRQREDAYSDECGATVDIFPVEDTYDSVILRRLQGIACMGAGFLLSCRKFYRDRRQIRQMLSSSKNGMKVLLIKGGVGFLISWGSVDFWTHFTNRVYTMCHNGTSEYVSIPSGRKHFFGETYLRRSFFGKQRIALEGTEFYCTEDIDAYMLALYGAEYMKEPPPERRERHVFLQFEL